MLVRFPVSDIPLAMRNGQEGRGPFANAGSCFACIGVGVLGNTVLFGIFLEFRIPIFTENCFLLNLKTNVDPYSCI